MFVNFDTTIFTLHCFSDDDAYNYVHISEAMIRLNKLVIGEAVLLIQNKQVVIKLVRQSLVPQNQNFKIFIAEEGKLPNKVVFIRERERERCYGK